MPTMDKTRSSAKHTSLWEARSNRPFEIRYGMCETRGRLTAYHFTRRRWMGDRRRWIQEDPEDMLEAAVEDFEEWEENRRQAQ